MPTTVEVYLTRDTTHGKKRQKIYELHSNDNQKYVLTPSNAALHSSKRLFELPYVEAVELLCGNLEEQLSYIAAG